MTILHELFLGVEASCDVDESVKDVLGQSYQGQLQELFNEMERYREERNGKTLSIGDLKKACCINEVKRLKEPIKQED